MDFDFVVGSAADQKNLTLRNVIMAAGPGAGPHTVVTPSPLAGIETILAKIGPGGRVGSLRVFNCISGTTGVSFRSSQLARLQGRFESDGSVEIFTPPSGLRDSVKEQVAVGGQGGFQIGSQFGFAGTGSGLSALHLTSLLDVPVKIAPL